MKRCASPPLVSIVVPSFLRSDHEVLLLREALATVRAQTLQSHEVIVVDDGSPMSVGDVLADAGELQLIRQENRGPAVARNTGIAAATGQYVVFLDADDHLLPSALETGVSLLQSHLQCGFTVGPREEMTYEGTAVPWTVSVPPAGGDIYLPLLRFDWYIIPPSCAMFRRDVVVEIGGFRDPWGADDLDFYLRAARRFRACCYQAPAVTRYRRYSTSSSRDGARMLRSLRAVYARQWPIVRGDREAEDAFRVGLARLTDIFTDCLIENVADRVRAGQWRAAARAAALLAREAPRKLPAMLNGVQEFARGTRQG